MDEREQMRDEEHFRQAERAMLYIDDAARQVTRAADALEADDAPPHLIAALRTAADALRADHKRLVQSAYWHAPSDDQQDLLAS